MPENEFKSYEDRMNEITERLEKGVQELLTSEKYTTYLNTMSKFHSYSTNNTILIAMQKPDATLVAGFDAWNNKFHRRVKKGEHGIQIISPVKQKEKKTYGRVDPMTGIPILDENGKQIIEEVEVEVTKFRVTTVFDISQTEGEDLPTLGVDQLMGNVEDFETLKQIFSEQSPVEIEFANIEGGAKGYFNSEAKKIVIQQGMSEQQTLKTMIHEITHAKLHDRDMSKISIFEKDKMTKEVEAESVAYTVCLHFGIDTSDYSFGYIAGWSSGREMKELKSSMDTIRKTSGEIIRGVEKKMKEITESLENTVDEKLAMDGAPALSMTFDNFVDAVKKYLPEKLSAVIKGASVTIEEVKKLQGQSYKGICIKPADSNVAPTFRAEPYFEMMKEGRPISAVLDRIAIDAANAFQDAKRIGEIKDMSIYENVKEHLGVRIVNTEKNSEMLEYMPHTEIQDLSVVYEICVPIGEQNGGALISNRMLDGWGVDINQLHTDALANAASVNPPTFKSMNQVLSEMMGGLPPELLPESDPPLYVASVQSQMNGAAVLAYPGRLESMAEELGSSYYVIPSSIHEVLVVPENENTNCSFLEEMIGEVNQNVLNDADYLSDRAYHYDAEEKVFELASSYEARMHETEMERAGNREEERHEPVVTFYVAESEEIPSLGEYKEGLTLNEAIEAYNAMPGDEKTGKTIGIDYRDGSSFDGQYSLMVAGEVSDEAIKGIDYLKDNPAVRTAYEDLKNGMNERKAEISKSAETVKTEEYKADKSIDKSEDKTAAKKPVNKDEKDTKKSVVKNLNEKKDTVNKTTGKSDPKKNKNIKKGGEAR